MSIINELGQTSYGRRQPVGVEGQAGTGIKGRTYVNPDLPQILDFTIGGTATAGLYRIRLTEPDGTVHDIPFTAGGGDTNATIETGLVAATPASLRGVATVAAGSGTSVRVTAAIGVELAFATTAPAPGTLAGATFQAPGGVNFGIGRVVIDGSGNVDGLPIVALPSAVSDELLFRGVTLRERFAWPNQGLPNQSSVDQIPPAELLSVAYEGEVYVRNRGSVAAAIGGAVFVVINTAGGQNLGEVRADDDAANSIPIGLQRARWIDPVAAGEIGRIFLRM